MTTAPTSTAAEIPDGTIPIVIRGGAADGKMLSLDLITAKLAIEAIERRHDVGRDGWTATGEFLSDLAAALAGAGVPDCTPTMAYRLWHVVTEKWLELKKNTP